MFRFSLVWIVSPSPVSIRHPTSQDSDVAANETKQKANEAKKEPWVVFPDVVCRKLIEHPGNS